MKPRQFVSTLVVQSLQSIITAKLGVQKGLVCYSGKDPFGAMSLELKFNTLQGGVITLDVP